MTRVIQVLLILSLVVLVIAGDDDLTAKLLDLQLKFETFDKTIKDSNQAFGELTRQVMLQQLFIEEKIRSDGASGIKTGRLDHQGTRSFFATTFTGPRVMAIHNHNNNNRTVGMGDFVAVLNGVDFRTRHNDYQIKKPATVTKPSNSIDNEATVPIEYPPVPDSVLQKATVTKQIEELKEYFLAWKEQNTTHRDYRGHFKPILCYLEGAWTTSDQNTIDESFDSDRHHLDANSWLELQDKIRFTGYTGRKSRLENYAYLPTTIIRVEDDKPVLAQWNYRILCHDIGKDIPTNKFITIDDLQSRMAYGRTMENHAQSRAARFRIVDDAEFTDQRKNYDFLDELMSEIPGKNGYDASLTDPGSDNINAMEYGTYNTPLNVAYYFRWFKGYKDAMGAMYQHKGYNDENLFMSMTTQPKVAPMSITHCKNGGKRCKTTTQRWTYAIPLEIIYLTPLQSWNPHKIDFKFEKVFVDGKNGLKPESALDGSEMNTFYHTPAEFYSSTDDANKDAADTVSGSLWIKDGGSTPRQVLASGVTIDTYNIPDVGVLRLRYPIMPLHQEGSVAWKELDALKDLVMYPRAWHGNMYYKNRVSTNSTLITLVLRDSRPSATIPAHSHQFAITVADIKRLHASRLVNRYFVITDAAMGHSHELQLLTQPNGNLIAGYCDGLRTCRDGHPRGIALPVDLRNV